MSYRDILTVFVKVVFCFDFTSQPTLQVMDSFPDWSEAIVETVKMFSTTPFIEKLNKIFRILPSGNVIFVIKK